ncbi:MAG: mandelate racemase/muconate lactonizing enzyme family protein [Acidimicrobiia bacterium]|nr:mandelate racemase/muconate lactonizing enzyme family protein [Acidimicrobiia bacterium]
MAAIDSVTTEVLSDERLINVIGRVRDVDGGEGVGEAWWGIPADPPARAASPIVAVIDDLLAPRAIARDADEIERLWFELWDWGYRYADQGIFAMGLSGLDLALWDLKGKRLDQPVAALLGGPIATGIPAYASFPPLRNADLLVSETKRALDHGFTAVKLHELDPELTAHLRDHFGDDLGIMVDVNGHFDPLEAIAHGRRLSELGVIWFEEPVRPMRDRDAIGRVGAAIDCDLAGGENEHTLLDFDDLLSTGALGYLQPEITKIGGLTPARRVSALAELHNVALAPHNFRLGPALYASIQWGFTSTATRWFELPWVPEGAGFSYPAQLPALVDGKVEPLTGPGLGC